MDGPSADGTAPGGLVNFQDLELGPGPFALRVYYKPVLDPRRASWKTRPDHKTEFIGVAIVHLDTGEILPAIDRALFGYGFTLHPGALSRITKENHFGFQ